MTPPQTALPEIVIEGRNRYTPTQKQAPVSLSQSGIQSLLSCPQQFYLNHLLKLKSPQVVNIKALLGTIIHAVMQQYYETIFVKGNSQTLKNGFVELMQNAQALVLEKHPPEESPLGIRLPSKLTYPNRIQLSSQLQQIEHAFTESPYFEQYTPEQYTCLATESWLNWHNPFKINNLVLTGRLDVLLQNKKTGHTLLVDFKTRNDYANKSDSANQALLQKKLETPPNWESTDPLKDTELQLLFYAFLLANDPQLNKMPDEIGFQYIRSTLNGPCNWVSVPKSVIEKQVNTLKEVVEKAYSQLTTLAQFLPQPSYSKCRLCDYQAICPKSSISQEADFLNLGDE